MGDENAIVIIQDGVRIHMSLEDYKDKVQMDLLDELSKIFMETMNVVWLSTEVSDFLDDYKRKILMGE